jgi:transcriptional regulator NrdR family protein
VNAKQIRPEKLPRGLCCTKCGHHRFRVIYTRAAPGQRLVRRRECRNCRERITTWETQIGVGIPVDSI